MNAKEQKIKEAYGEYWETFKKLIDENGWYNWFESKTITNIDDLEFESSKDGFKLRPKSLSGIENNNGWTILKGTKNEIQHDGDIWILNKNGNIELWLESQFLPLNYATHWKPIVKPQPPIY